MRTLKFKGLEKRWDKEQRKWVWFRKYWNVIRNCFETRHSGWWNEKPKEH